MDASLTLPAPHLVASDSALADCCAVCARAPRIAFGTEFIRTDTFHPKLGLIQLCDGDTVWLVDPLAIGDFALRPDPETLDIATNPAAQFPVPQAAMPGGIIDLHLDHVEEIETVVVMRDRILLREGCGGNAENQCESKRDNLSHHMLPCPAWPPCTIFSWVTASGTTAPSGVIASSAVSGGSTMKVVIMPEAM